MVTALKEVFELNPSVLKINKKNTNPYCILTEEEKTSTAYCFSVPIYNNETHRLVRREFTLDQDVIHFLGSNAKGYINQGKLSLSNKNGSAIIGLPAQRLQMEPGKVKVESWSMTPSFNGIYVHTTSNIAQFTIQTNREFSVQYCSKSFGLMQEKFQPFLTVTPLFGKSSSGEISPSIVKYNRESNLSYTITVQAPEENSLDFELNLHEPKLFQDTTVESLHPTENNAYGGISFLGNTKQTGEQWLYSRLDTTKLSDFYCVTIKKILIYLPRWNHTEDEIAIFTPVKRFCSFGSNWENRVGQAAQFSTAVPQGKYLTIDVTKLFTDVSEQSLIQTEGFILKAKTQNNHTVAISTGDNYTLPQIMEVQYEY